MTDKLEDGFYWVRLGHEWSIAQRVGSNFYSVHEDCYWHESAFDEIDPRPIKREGGE